MPYFGPAPAESRPRLHRRAYTAPHGGGAFGPLGALPRRTKPTMFSLARDADDDDAADEIHDRGLPQLNPNNSLRISISHDADDSLRTHPAAVPFPRTSPTSLAPPPRPNISRTSSTPIMLSNGKPLKSSLKSSLSSPQIASSSATPTLHHPRARSEPSSPHSDLRKNVHFPTNELATVRVFNRSAKPASVSRVGGGDDTETETEGELSTGSNSGFIRGSSAVVPFPRSPLGRRRYEIDPDVSSPIPTTQQSSSANVFLESLTFTPSLQSSPSSTAGISGTLLVRNIAYEKHVAVRFTLDDWQTTSEVMAKHLVSLSTLPSTFIDCKKLTYGDIIALSPLHSQPTPPTDSSASSLAPEWDRFTFKIKLEDYAHPSLGGLTKRTMWLVARYTTGTGVEAWDNNSGKNYKVAFREQPQHHHHQQQPYVRDDHATALMQKRSRVFAVSAPTPFVPTTLTTPSITPSQQQLRQEHAKSIAETTLTKLKKLNLRNYAAPNALPTVRTPTDTTPRVEEKLEFFNGFPAHLTVPGMDNEKEGRREEESDTESEESIETPVPTTPNSIALGHGGGVETGVRIRSRTPSPTEVRILAGSLNGVDGIPLVTISPPSLSASSSLHPPMSLRGRQPVSNNAMLSMLSKNMDHPHGLEMGTSPPFSMMPDFTTSLKSGFWQKEEAKRVEKDVPSREESVYWSWGGSESEQSKPDNHGEEEEERKKSAVLLDGIREKSTSPLGETKRVSPSGDRKPTPVKMNEGKKSLGVVSPQPRGKQDWSKVGSGWMNKSNSPRGSPNSTPPVSPPPIVSSSESSTPTPESVALAAASSTPTPTQTTPTQASTTSNTVATTQSQQDSIYQAFVRQWCFAQGPSHPVIDSSARPRFSTSGGDARDYGFPAPQLPRRRRGKSDPDTSAGEKGAGGGSGESRGGDGPLVV